MRDIFALERDVTEDIARQVQARLSTKQGGVHLQQLQPMNPMALEAFLQGNYHMNEQWGGSGDTERKLAAEYFQPAIVADPNFAPAYRGMALAHENRLLGSREDSAIVSKAMEKAVEIEPTRLRRFHFHSADTAPKTTQRRLCSLFPFPKLHDESNGKRIHSGIGAVLLPAWTA